MVLCAALLAPFAPLAPARLAPPAPLAPLALFLLGHHIGAERSTVATTAVGSVLTTHFEYLDRGTKVALDSTLTYAPGFTPLAFESHGKSYRYFAVDVSVPKASGAPAAFTLDGMAPIAAQGALIQYWLAHGRPATITLEPSGDGVRITERSTSPLMGRATQGATPPLRHFTIDGVIWGREDIWLDASDMHVAAALTTAGVLAFEAFDAKQEPLAASWRRDHQLTPFSLRADQPPISPRASGTFALVGGRVIDATGGPALERGTVLVRNGRIERVGAAGSFAIPGDAPIVDVSGKSVLPGLWDMHAHVGQPEWGPVYLASGVTTVRDMGGEFDIVTRLRDAWKPAPEFPPAPAGMSAAMQRVAQDALQAATLSGAVLGPRLLLAGLVDGPGAASFGHVTAADADEGRAVVAKYKAAGFQQMKLYTLLDRPAIAAIIAAAHAAGMTVTGHIPTALSGGMREGIEMGMDHIAHLTVRDAPGSDAMRETIAFLKAHDTVIDPTVSWNELLGRSAETPIASFLPGIEHAAPALRRLIDGANGGAVTPAQARDRLARSLQIIKALHDGGIPIVAGTDKGVPGVSVAREIELYVQAGLTPMDAIRAASAVPARVMGLAADSGTIAPGLRADLIVVDGNPLERISDIRNVILVSTSGRLYDAAPLWRAGGFR